MFANSPRLATKHGWGWIKRFIPWRSSWALWTRWCGGTEVLGMKVIFPQVSTLTLRRRRAWTQALPAPIQPLLPAHRWSDRERIWLWMSVKILSRLSPLAGPWKSWMRGGKATPGEGKSLSTGAAASRDSDRGGKWLWVEVGAWGRQWASNITQMHWIGSHCHSALPGINCIHGNELGPWTPGWLK